MKKPDPIIDRVRAARTKLSEELGNDPARIAEAGRAWHAQFMAERKLRAEQTQAAQTKK